MCCYVSPFSVGGEIMTNSAKWQGRSLLPVVKERGDTEAILSPFP